MYQRMLGAMVAVTILAVLPGCQRAAEDPLDAFASIATVTRGSIADVVQMAGQVQAAYAQEMGVAQIGRVVEVLVQPGQEVQAGQALLRLDTLELERKLREAAADLQAADAALTAAETGAGAAELANAQADLASAKVGVEVAKMQLDLAEKAGVTLLREKVADADFALQVARDELQLKEIGEQQPTIRALEYDLAFDQRMLRDLPVNDAQRPEVEKRLTETEGALNRARTWRSEALQVAGEEVEKKAEELAAAKAALARALAGEDDPANAPRLAHRAALAKLDTAQKAVDKLQAGGESEAVQAARTAYEAAQAQVETATANLQAATPTALFDATVVSIYVQPGDYLQAGDKAMFLADFRQLQVQAQVTEMDVPRLGVGQQARITFDVYPGRLFYGQVLQLPVRSISQSGLVYYAVVTSLDRQGTDIRLGMFANVRVVIGERQDVLTVPVAAILYRSPEEAYVKVRGADGKTSEQTVQVGLNDGILVEVLSGLSEGQQVLVPLVAPASQSGKVILR
jgi:RND family efflux transporter MFP subunit